MRAIVCEGPPGPEAPLRWAEVPDPSPGPGEVVLDVRATSVNRADLLQRAGRYPPPPGASPLLGLEAAGTVREVGPGVTGWRAGDPAMALLAGGGYAERAVAPAALLLPVPAAVGLPAAGAVMEVWTTAHLNLVTLGRLAPGERVLVHGGSGGVGTAALQLARARGAEVWTTAGGPARAARCLALGAHRALDHRDEDFVAALRAAGGADLILDCLGGGALARNLDALAPDGRLVVIGLQQGAKAELPLGALLARRLTIVGSTLRALPAARKAAAVAGVRAEVWPGLDAGDLRVVVDRVVPLPRAAEAHAALAAGEVFGKVVLEVPEGAG